MPDENKKPWIVSFMEKHKPLVVLIVFNLVALPFAITSSSMALFVNVCNVSFLLWCIVRLIATWEINEYHDMTIELWEEQSKLNKSIGNVFGDFDERLKALENKE